jgi:hypothetical protein
VSPEEHDQVKSLVATESIQLKPNDVLHFPDCLTGAGEFEGCYFVGIKKQKNNNNDEYIRLLRASIEHPVFPEQVVESMLGSSVSSLKRGGQQLWQRLRQVYEPLFERLLKEQGGLSMLDLMGGQDVLEEYWSCPDVGRDLSEKARKGKPSREQNDTEDEESYYYTIPLCECTVLALSSP